MAYKAVFGIDCGVSPGFLKSPEYVKREEAIPRGEIPDVILSLAKRAYGFSRDYLSNPETDLVTVTVLELYNNGKLLDQREFMKRAGYDSIQGFDWDQDRLSIRRHMLENLLSSNRKI